MIILSVDYGDRRTGIAVCDKLEMLATGVNVITEWNKEVLASKVAEEAATRNAELIVVGLPKNMDGSSGFRAEACKEFGELLITKTEIPVTFWDERLTTVSAHSIMNELNIKGKKRKEKVDAVAAEIILQNYIDYRKATGENNV